MKKIALMLRALSLFSGYAPMCHGSDQQISIRNNQSDIELYVNEMLVGKGIPSPPSRKKRITSSQQRKMDATQYQFRLKSHLMLLLC